MTYSKLVDEIRKIIDPTHPQHMWPTSLADACVRWRQAIDVHGADAEDYSTDLSATRNGAAFETTLYNGLYNWWTRAHGADAFRNAWREFWYSATFNLGILPPSGGPCPNYGGNLIFGIELSSAIISVADAGIYNDLYSEFGSIIWNGNIKAQNLAAIFHARTTSTDITNRIDGRDTTPPPVGPLEIYNLCTIF